MSSLWIIPIVGWHHFVNEGVRTIPSTVCDTEYARSSILKITTSILNFYLPLAIMYVLYIRIFAEIRRRSLIEVCERIPPTMESFSSESLHVIETEPSVLEQPKHGRFLRRPSRLSFCLRQRQRSERPTTRKSAHFDCLRQMSEPLRSRSKEVGVVCSGFAGKTGGCGGELIAMERLKNRIYDRIASRKDSTPSERTGDRVLDQRVGVIAGDERGEKVLLLNGMSFEEAGDEPDKDDRPGSRSEDVASSSNESSLPRRQKEVDDGEDATRKSPLSKDMSNVPEEYVEGVDSDSVFARQLSGSTVELATNQKGEIGIIGSSKRETRRAPALLDCLWGQTVGRQSTTDSVRCHDGPLRESPAIRNIKSCDDFERTCLSSSPASSVSSRNSEYSGFGSRSSLRNVHGEDGTLPHRVRLPKEAHPVKARIINRSIVNDSSYYRTCSHRRQNAETKNEKDDKLKKTTEDHVRGFTGITPVRRTSAGHNQNGHTRRYLYLALTQRSSNPNPATDSGKRKLKSDRLMGAKSRSSSLQKEIKAARQVGVIMGAFTICFLPYFVCFTVVSFCEWCNNARLMTAVTWFGYLNSTLNPFLYPLCNVNFRLKFRQMLSPASAAAAAAANNRDALPISRQMSVRGPSRLQPGSRLRLDSILDLDRN